MKFWSGYVVGALFCLIFLLGGCGQSAPAISMDDAVFLTEDALAEILMGLPPELAATRPTADPPLLRRGVYETAVLSTDAESFEKVSRGSLKVKTLQGLQKRVVEDLSKYLKPGGYRIVGADSYPPTTTEAKTLIVTLTPTTQEGGSPQDKAQNKGKTFVLFRLTVRDPVRNEILAQRDYYSGRDVMRPGGERHLRWR